MSRYFSHACPNLLDLSQPANQWRRRKIGETWNDRASYFSPARAWRAAVPPSRV